MRAARRPCRLLDVVLRCEVGEPNREGAEADDVVVTVGVAAHRPVQWRGPSRGDRPDAPACAGERAGATRGDVGVASGIDRAHERLGERIDAVEARDLVSPAERVLDREVQRDARLDRIVVVIRQPAEPLRGVDRRIDTLRREGDRRRNRADDGLTADVPRFEIGFGKTFSVDQRLGHPQHHLRVLCPPPAIEHLAVSR